MSLERKGASFSFWNLEKNQITRNITVGECIFPYPGMGFIYIRAQERNLLAFSLIGKIFVSKLGKCFSSAHPMNLLHTFVCEKIENEIVPILYFH